jgi:hypothetical protein
VAFAMEKAGKTGDLDAVMANMTNLEAQFDTAGPFCSSCMWNSHAPDDTDPCLLSGFAI